jgi:2-methylcitrate dehydratase PrpD
MMDNPAPTIAESLAEFIARLDYAAIPAAVRAQAKLHWLDSIGVALAASGFDFARKACAGLAALGGEGHPVIGMRERLGLRDAILMNGMLVHGIEFDDTSLHGRIHPSAFCVPCALGAGSHARASGKEVLTAYIGGVECAVRLGMAAHGGFTPAGFNAVGVIGAFGSVLTAGKLLGLDAAQLAMAQGIAYSTASGNREFSAADSWTKRFEAGWPAASAITAAMLAKEGYVGPRTAYEGRFGVFTTYLNAPAPAADLAGITSGLGRDWEFSRILIKLLPSCYFNHAIINSTVALVTQHDLAASDIRSIRVLVPPAGITTVCEPRDKKVAPNDIAAAQFSVYFSAAAAATRRRFTLEELTAAALNDSAIRALAQKVEYVADPQSNFPAHYSGGVEITMADGRSFSAREDVNMGSTEKPLPASAIENKFLANAERVMAPGRAAELRDRLLDIEKYDNIGALAAKLGAS